jgi:two-component system chemotaxis response regulator CheY
MKQILIVEDETATRQLLAKYVREAGHAVLQASSGRDAWELLQENPDVDLLVTDIVMLEMGGFKLIEQIRNDAVFEKLPVIVVSGRVGAEDIATLPDKGATAFLSKPVSRSDLKSYLRELL